MFYLILLFNISFNNDLFFRNYINSLIYLNLFYFNYFDYFNNSFFIFLFNSFLFV